jgi:hypothetical protein
MSGLFSIDDEVRKLRERATESLALLDVLAAEGVLLVQELRLEVAAVRRAREAAGSQEVKVTTDIGAQG